MKLVCIADLPGPHRPYVILCDRVSHRGIFPLVCVEGIAVFVLCAAYFSRTLGAVDLEHGVLLTVDLGVDAQAEKVLVVVCLRRIISSRVREGKGLGFFFVFFQTLTPG